MTNTQQSANTVFPIQAFTDNYIWCIHNQTQAVVVDPGEAAPVLAYLAKHNLTLASILITHHHFDHVGGVAQLLEHSPNINVYGPYNPNIRTITHRVQEHDTVVIEPLGLALQVLETPGHTLDHIVYYDDTHLFCGDTLFSAGCGRMFEGKPEVFNDSLQKLSELSANLNVYCTHEYTQANIHFALSVDADNHELATYAQWVKNARAGNKITLPSTIQQERAINPFLRCHIPYMQTSMLGEKSTWSQSVVNNAAVACFAKLRQLKDNF